MATFEPRGAWTALVTPFGADGTIDEAAFRRLVEFQISEGIDGLVPCGTTGESPTLEWKEHHRLVHQTVEFAGGRAGVLAGSGSNNTSEAIRATRDAKEAGAQAALLVDCYYNGPSSAELRDEYYGRVLDAVPEIPLVPYIIPGRSGCQLAAADLAVLHARAPERVPAVKQATGDLVRMRLDRELAGQGLAIFSGDDDMTVDMMVDRDIGACGVISVMSNLAPRAVVEMVRALAEGDEAKGREKARALQPLLQLVGVSASSSRTLPGGRHVEVQDKFRNPLPLKTMMAGLGMIERLGRAPLGKMSRPAVETCRSALREVHESVPTVLRPIEAAFDVRIADRLADDRIWSALSS